MTKKALLFLFILGLNAYDAEGQIAVTGQIRGVVSDASGGSLRGVSITATSPALMTPRTAATDLTGRNLFDALPPGDYELTYTLYGYMTIAPPAR